MRVKVGNQWFTAKPGLPLMVELTEQDRINIAKMDPSNTRYATFDDEDVKKFGVEACQRWVQE